MKHKSQLLSCLCAAVLVFGAASPARTSANDPASEFYEDAVERFSADDYAGAVVQLKNALQRSPNYLPATLLLARAYLAQGQGQAAEEMMREAIQLGADRRLSAALLGEALLQQHKFRQLLKELDPDEFEGDVAGEVYELRGTALLETSNREDAAAAYTEAMALRPDRAGPLVGLARLAMQSMDFREAERLVDEALRVDPESADAASVKGSIAHATNDFEAALAHYGEALALDSHHTGARMARAGLLIDLGRDEEAAADVEALLETAVFEPKVHYLKSVLADRRGDTEEARKAASASVAMIEELRGDYLDARAPLLLTGALAYYRLGQTERTRDLLERYLKLVPHAVGPRRLLGGIYLQMDEVSTAQTVLEPALETAPDDVPLLSLTANAYSRRGLHKSATDLLTHALEVSGGAAEIRTQLGLSELKAGRAERGRRLLEEAFDAGNGHRPAGNALILWHMRAGNDEEAVRVGRQLVDTDPADISARNLYGSALVGAGDLAQAHVQFERILEADATFQPARINLAKIDRLRGEPAQARRRLDAILADSPNEVETLLEMAALQQSLGQPDAAHEWLEKARSADLSAIKPRLRLVEFLLERGDHKDALGIAKEAAGIAPEDLTVLPVLARAYIANDKRDIAKAIYNDMVSAVGFDAAQLIHIARMQVAVGAMVDALYSLEKAINSAPDNLAAQVGAIEVMLSTERLERAEERAAALLENNPELPDAHRLLAEALLARGDCEGGLARMEAARERRTDQLMVVRLATARLTCGQGERAARELAAWIETHPTGAYAHKALAEMLLYNGDEEAAIRHYEIVAEAVPNDAGTLNNLAYLYIERDPERALRYARRAVELVPGSASANDTLGWVLLRGGNAEAALAYLREAHSRDARNPEILYHMASALWELGRRDEARRQLQRALESGVDFPGVADARSLLETITP